MLIKRTIKHPYVNKDQIDPQVMLVGSVFASALLLVGLFAVLFVLFIHSLSKQDAIKQYRFGQIEADTLREIHNVEWYQGERNYAVRDSHLN